MAYKAGLVKPKLIKLVPMAIGQAEINKAGADGDEPEEKQARREAVQLFHQAITRMNEVRTNALRVTSPWLLPAS